MTRTYGLPNLQQRTVEAFLVQELRNAPDSGWPMASAGPVRPSMQPMETYAGVGAAPGMTEFKGERSKTRLIEQVQTVINKDYEATLQVTGDEILFNKTGDVEKRIGELTQSYTEHWQDLLSDLLVAGEATTTTVDGKTYFATNHETGDSGAQDNDLSFTVVSTSDVTAAEAEKALMKAVEKCLGYKNDKGRPKNSGIRKFDIVVPMPLLFPFTQALKAPFIADGTVGPRTPISQVLGGWTFNLHAEPRLASAVKFYVVAGNGSAFIRQEAQKLEVTSQDRSSPLYHNKRLLEFGIFTKRGANYGDWSQCVLTTLTT